jgi:hypothetical protein
MNLAIAHGGDYDGARADPEPMTMRTAQMRPANLLFTWAKCVCVSLNIKARRTLMCVVIISVGRNGEELPPPP